MSDIYFKRDSIKCVHCGGNDFHVSVNYCVPRAIQLECKCGYITPIAFIDRCDNCYGVNGNATNGMYADSFCEDLDPYTSRQAVIDDVRKYREINAM